MSEARKCLAKRKSFNSVVAMGIITPCKYIKNSNKPIDKCTFCNSLYIIIIQNTKITNTIDFVTVV